MRRLKQWVAAVLVACAGGAPSDGEERTATRPEPPSAARVVDRPVLRVHVLRVDAPAGGGDAILIADSTASPPRHVLVDAGNDGAAAGALRELDVPSLDLMVLTHAHHDHYGGMDDVLDAVPVRAFAFNGQARTAVTYLRLLGRVRDEVPRVMVVDSAVRRIRLGEGIDATTLVLLPPLSEHLARDTDDGESLNEGSLAVRIERGRFSFLTTGDAEHEANERFAAGFPERVDVDVLKVGHHGSSDATRPSWLDATTPAVAIVSANGTTHPHAGVLRMLRDRPADLYCTAQHGRISVHVARTGAFAVDTERAPDLRCQPGSDS